MNADARTESYTAPRKAVPRFVENLALAVLYHFLGPDRNHGGACGECSHADFVAVVSVRGVGYIHGEVVTRLRGSRHGSAVHVPFPLESGNAMALTVGDHHDIRVPPLVAGPGVAYQQHRLALDKGNHLRTRRNVNRLRNRARSHFLLYGPVLVGRVRKGVGRPVLGGFRGDTRHSPVLELVLDVIGVGIVVAQENLGRRCRHRVLFQHDFHARRKHAHGVVVFEDQRGIVAKGNVVAVAHGNRIAEVAADNHVAVLACQYGVARLDGFVIFVKRNFHGCAVEMHTLGLDGSVRVVGQVLVAGERSVYIESHAGVVTKDQVLVVVAAHGDILFAVLARHHLHGGYHGQVQRPLVRVGEQVPDSHLESRGAYAAEHHVVSNQAHIGRHLREQLGGRRGGLAFNAAVVAVEMATGPVVQVVVPVGRSTAHLVAPYIEQVVIGVRVLLVAAEVHIHIAWCTVREGIKVRKRELDFLLLLGSIVGVEQLGIRGVTVKLGIILRHQTRILRPVAHGGIVGNK